MMENSERRKEDDIQRVLTDPKEFQRLVKEQHDLCHLAEKFPQHAETLIQRVLTDPEEFQRFVKNQLDLCHLAEKFPQHAETLIQRVLTNPEEFQRLVKEQHDLCHLAEKFPQHAETLIQRVLTNLEEFQRLVKLCYDLCYLAGKFPQHAETLIQRVLTGPEEFQRLVKVCYDLCYLAEKFPRHAETLIQRVLTNPEEFQRLVKDAYNLRCMAGKFPQHAEVFGKGSIEEALKAVRERHAYAMEETKIKSEGQKQDINSILYFEQSFPILSYSDLPTNKIDPSRLIAGLPAFVKEKNSYKKIPKKLIIPGFDISQWDQDKKILARLRIQWLKKLGFTVYFYSHEGLIPFDSRCFEKGEFEQGPWPIEAKLAEKLQIPADEISLLNEDSFNLLIEGDDSDWQEFSPFKSISLGDHPISSKSFESLLQKHGHEIESLEIGNCPNIKGIPNELSSTLNHLLDLKIKYSPYAEELLQSIVLQLPKLEKLTLIGYLFRKTFMGPVEFSNLLSLTIQSSPIDSDKLSTVLQGCYVVKRLEINDCFNLDSQHIRNLNLKNLEVLIIKSSNISLISLQKLLESAPNLRSIHISHCHNLSSGDLDNLELKKIEEIHVENCNLSDNSIEVLKNSAPTTAEITVIKATIKEKVISEQTIGYNQNFGQMTPGSDQAIQEHSRSFNESPDENTTPNGSIPDSRISSVDANTTPDKSKIEKSKRRFIGKFRSPETRDIRLIPYNQLTLNRNADGIKNPFLLIHNMPDLSSQPLLNNLKSEAALYEIFNQKGDNYYLGRFYMQLDTTWKPMPSVSPNEILEKFYINPRDDVDIKKSYEDGFYYIRLKKPSSRLEHLIEILIYYKKEPAYSFDQLPEEIKRLVEDFRTFNEKPLKTETDWSAKEYLAAIIEQRSGSCRHRAVAFKHLMNKNFPHIPAHIIKNDSHMYVEVYYQGHWVPCDLGGYAPSEAIIDNTAFPEQAKEKIPSGRYFRTGLEPSIKMLMGSNPRNVLINCHDTQKLRIALQRHCQLTHQACYYINSPSELQCANPYIERDKLTGYIRKGPGGPLYDFIQKHQDAALIVNYDNFKPDDIARFNSLLDNERLVDNVAIPDRYKIIGLLDPNKPDAYQGSDFYSRFDERYDRNNTLISPVSLSTSTSNKIDRKQKTIELNGGNDWQARLIGSWLLKGQQLIYQEGQLMKALNDGYSSITLNNPPINNPEFERFLADMELHQGIFHQGRMELKLPKNFNLSFSRDLSFTDKTNYLSFSEDTQINSDAHILSETGLSYFLGCYECDETTKGLLLKPGYIEQCQNKTINIYLTETLSPHSWLSLVEKAREQHVHFRVSLAPNVELPKDLRPEQTIFPLKCNPKTHTHLQISDKPHLLQYPAQALVIDISELEPADLLPSIHSGFNEDTLLFQFSEKSSFLLKALSENKTVVLKGTWPNELARALEPFIAKRLATSTCDGELWIVSDNNNTFSFMPETENKLASQPPKDSIHLKADFENRLDIVNAVLAQKPFVFLAGATGVGKTQFITTIWQKKHPVCYYGLDQLSSWISDTRPGLKTLFIDEANITSNQWSAFEGLFNTPPAIFHNGQYCELSEEHKVIFAGNPLSYGGERQQPAFFEHHRCEVGFTPLPREFIANLLPLDDETAKPILDVYDYISQLDSNDTLITPREVIMAANLTIAALENNPGAYPSGDIAGYFAFNLCQKFVSKKYQKEFEEKFKPKQNSIINNIQLDNLIINDTNRPAIEALIHQLNLRKQRVLSNPKIPVVGGLGGIILEGDPGLGKSALVTEVLAAHNMKEGVGFYRIPASYDREEKQRILLKAFHEGKIAIIDEINSSPMIERLLNALLEGHDLEGRSAAQKGFMLIGTQNPITFKGRRKTTLPLLHRLQTVEMRPYTENEQREILRCLGLPPQIIVNMMAEFEQQQKEQSNLCFRDLLKCAQQWIKNPAHQEKIQHDLTPQFEVEKISKLIAVANIENYYAKQLGFSPIPLKANKTGSLSIRHLAKKGGSTQGEVLEFSRWNDIVTNMGYETQSVDFKDNINLFTETIIESLKKGDLPMLALSAEEKSEQPDPDPFDTKANELSAVITGYDPTTDKITLIYSGGIYHVALATLYFSSQALPSTRHPEHYNKNRAYSRENKLNTPKYLLEKDKGEKKSITPKENSGFQAKLLIIKRPSSAAALLQKREKRLAEYVSHQPGNNLPFFQKKQTPAPPVPAKSPRTGCLIQ